MVLVNGKIASDIGAMLIVNMKKLNSDIKIFAPSENEITRLVLDYGADEFAVEPISPTFL